MLLALIKDHEQLTLIEREQDWVRVRHRNGFPVWIHQEFVSVEGSTGTMIADNVNTRAVPVIAEGTVMGQLNRGEQVQLLGSRNQWFRVTAPARFEAWAKAKEIDQLRAQGSQARIADQEIETKQTVSTPATLRRASRGSVPPTSSADNEWLFSAPDNAFTLQLGSFDEPAKVAAFLSSIDFKNDAELKQFTSRAQSASWTYFLYGVYDTKAAAEIAKSRLNQPNAWVS